MPSIFYVKSREFLRQEKLKYSILWNNQQMQLYEVNFTPLLGSLYMFRGVLHTHHQEYNL